VDKQSFIGLGLIALILGGWFYTNLPSDEQIAKNKRIRDSIDRVEKKMKAEEAAKIAAQQKKTDTLKSESPVAAVVSDSAKALALTDKYKDFTPALSGTPTTLVIENDLLKLHVSTKGGFIEKVELKNYQRAGSKASLVLFEKDSTRFALSLNAYNRTRIFSTDEFYFKAVKQDASTLVMRLETAKPGSYLEFSYAVKPGSYAVKSELRCVGMQDIISEDQLQLNWSMLYPSQEKYIVKEKEAATVYYKQAENAPDYINPMKDAEQSLNEADVKWVAFKQQFFNAAIVADNVFARAGSAVRLSQRPESTSIVKSVSSELGIPYTHQPDEKFGFEFYFGPNHYNTLKAYGHELERIIPTGWSVFSYINTIIVIPLFNALSGINMGIVILILTILVKIALLPIAYKTYMSGARMRVLKPETDALNAKFEKNPDPMKKQQEQMALYNKAGVNPLSGCLPLLLQFPILIALFNFVPAAIELRQRGFLWADDLSTYDSIWTFGDLPFIGWAYGDHISLFAALMFVSTIIYTYMNSNMMPQQSGQQMPGMKFMMYFMPVIFLAVMNRYAAGLSWYYFLANMFTFLQNWIMKKLISDTKIRAEIEANMKKPAKTSSFQKRLEEMTRQRQAQIKKR